jgi:hypothetical protein
MNALVASVIRTYTPIIVGQIAAWFILIHVPLDPATVVALTAVIGGLLSAIYYTLVRVLEQQWPGAGVLLGLTASPDTYSKGEPAPAEVAKQTSIEATAVDPAAVSFASTQAKVDALTAEPVAPVEVTPVFTPPAA